MALNVLLVGDIVGKLGRRTLGTVLPDLRRELDIGFVIANGENTAGGRGLTPSTADELLRSGVDGSRPATTSGKTARSTLCSMIPRRP
jgi:calcineurin-like phosphoesterase